MLVSRLQSAHTLIILSGFRTILRNARQTNACHDNCRSCNRLLGHLNRVTRRDYILLAAHRGPRRVTTRRKSLLPIHALGVRKISASANHRVIITGNLTASAPSLSDLITRCQNGPLTLGVTTASVHSVFTNDVAQFLTRNDDTFDNVNALLRRRYSHLSPARRGVVC